ncbi:uncharacterized protein LOC135210546 [Macrobrachium nipponense]|uniref:uncharacterized protein LOC135210546 n=1 Tax=Macrobrachium nipponense TaxID=159736 RepID=UPI0030C7EEA2
MNSMKTCGFLLLVVPLLFVCSPVMAARRAVKEGCLNYGPACLGGHGKRSSLHTSIPELRMIRILYRLMESPVVSSSHSKDDDAQGADLHHQYVRPSNGRTPTQDYETLSQAPVLDSEDRDEYPDEDDRRIALEMTTSTKDEPETYSDWDREMESRTHHKEKNDNRNYVNLRSWRKR